MNDRATPKHQRKGNHLGDDNALKHSSYSGFRTLGRVEHVPDRAAVNEVDHDLALPRASAMTPYPRIGTDGIRGRTEKGESEWLLSERFCPAPSDL